MAPLGRSKNHGRRLAAIQNFELPRLSRVLLTLAAIVTALWLGWSVLKTNFYRGAIPSEIGLTFGLATTGSDSNLVAALLPIPPKACGGAIFGLSSGTAEAINREGTAFLSNARQGRGYDNKSDRLYYYYSYVPWQETPLPDGWLAESLLGQWYGLSCMSLSNSFAESITKAAGNPGSFFTTGPSKMLLVVPELRLVVYTYTH
jgi:hypothetical protein